MRKIGAEKRDGRIIRYWCIIRILPYMSLFISSTALTPPVVAIGMVGLTVAGDMFTLSCRVTVVEGLVAQPDVIWVDSGGNAVMSGVNDVNVGNVMRSGRESTLGLEFNPLHTSHGGQYICRATINIPSIGVSGLSGSSSQNVVVQSKHCSEFMVVYVG